MDSTQLIKDDLQRKKAERAKLESQIAEIETALAVLARYEVASPLVMAPAPCVPSTQVPGSGSGDVQPDRLQANHPKEIMAAVVELLRARGSMHLVEIAEAISRQGLRAGGSNSHGYLAAILSRNKTIYGLVSSRKSGWSLDAQNGNIAGVASKPTPAGAGAPQIGDIRVTPDVGVQADPHGH